MIEYTVLRLACASRPLRGAGKRAAVSAKVADLGTNSGARLAHQAARQLVLGREEEKDLPRRAGADDIGAGRRLIASHLRVVI